LNHLAASLPEGFAYFDTSNPELIKNAYVQLLVGAGVMSVANLDRNTPASAVTVEGDTATVNPALVEMTANGEKVDNSTISSSPIKLKKNETGSWVMIADSAMSGSADTELNTEK
jgi:hypothetical protein